MSWIKNIDTVSNTYGGQLIEAGAFYEIQKPEAGIMADDDTLAKDICNGKAQISETGQDAGLISGYNNQLNFLKSLQPQKTIEELTQSNLKTKWAGLLLDFTKEVETHLYIAMPFKYLRGGKIEFSDAQFGKDDFDLQVVSKGATPAQDTILDDYLTAIPAPKTGELEIKSKVISAAMPAGLHLRCSYRSAAGATVNVTGGLRIYGKNDA